jgi:hypothetical protein
MTSTLLRVPRLFFLLPLFAVVFFSGNHTAFAVGEPVVANVFPQSIMPTSAIPTGEVTDEGVADVIGIWVEYGADTNYGGEVQRYNLNELTLPGTFDVPITGLTCNTTYHYRFKIRNNGMLDGYSTDDTFTTSECYPDDIVSHWTLNEGDPSLRYDSVGDNDLTSHGNPSTLTAHHNDGLGASTGQYLDSADNASLSTGGETDFTISLWVKLASKTGTQVFVSKYGNGAGGEYAVYFENAFDRFVFSTYSSDDNYFVKADTLGSPEVGTWYHIIATHDAVNNVNKITVNGIGPDTVSGVPEHTDSTADFVIGAFGPSYLFPADAVIDDVRFSKTVHAPEEDPVDLFAGGDGTELDPYQITTCQQLQDINENLDAYYVLNNSIDCVGTESWNGNEDEWVDGVIAGELIPDEYTIVENNGYFGFEPIGQDSANAYSGPGFTGSFDGQGYTISNLWIFRKLEPNVGLFGYTTNATIKDVTLSNARIVGQQNTGGFVGYGSVLTLEDLVNNNGMVRAYLSYRGGGIVGSLENSPNVTRLTVTEGNVHGSGNVIGGLIGSVNNSTVTNSETSADIDGGEYIGGAFGQLNTSTVTDVTASGNVVSNSNEDEYLPGISKSGYYTGGFAGYIAQSTITNGNASGLVSAEGDFAGGFSGYITDSDIFESSATGNVSGNESVGGFGGMIFASEITDSTATGDVTSIGGIIGGFAGQTFCESAFLRVSASGNVTAGNGNAGGFTGFDGCEGPGSTFTQVSAHGDVTGNNVIGGFIGESYSSTFINVYSSGSASGNDQVGSFAGTLNSGSVTNAYARGLVILTDAGTLVGGFANNATDTVFTNSFWDGEAIEQEDACHTGACSGLTELTTAQARTQSIYTDADWDFDTIWQMNSNNSRYPHFVWESFEEEEPELLSLSASDITDRSAVLRGQVISGSFGPGTLGFAFSEEPFEIGEGSPALLGPADDFGTINEETGVYTLDLDAFMTPDNYLGLTDLVCNTTYYYLAIGYIGFGEGGLITAENELSFTTLPCSDEEPEPEPEPAPRRSRVSGYASASFLAQVGIKLDSANTTPLNPLGDSKVCNADQTLTQNLRAPSRNGVFDKYTGGIVKEAKILQAHLNRLGFNSGLEDGILGPISTRAIKRMQTFLKTTPDGYVGPLTRNLINNSCK